MKANSRKQIKNKLIKVDTLESNFSKAIAKTFGETTNIVVEKCYGTEYVDFYGNCPTYLAYDKDEDGYNKTFKFAVVSYKSNNECRIKVIKLLDL